MKSALAFSALFASAFAQDLFGAISARSASPIHLLPLTANGGKIVLGGQPSSYCPPEVGDTCAGLPGNWTVFAGGQGTLSLAVVVPGGQQVYVAPDGAVSYTMPHSVYKPDGSIVDGWTKTDSADLGRLTFKNSLIACPTTANKPYQVFAQLPGLTFKPECLGFNVLTSETEKADAWEY